MESSLDTSAKAILVGQKINMMLDIVERAKELRKALSDEHKDMLKGADGIEGLDSMSVAFGLAQASEVFFGEFESTLYEIANMARHQASEAIEYRHIGLVESFIASLSELKPRSIRHLENFFSASTDGEWVDGLFLAKGKDSEFRCIDRCSDDVRSEFGITSKK